MIDSVRPQPNATTVSACCKHGQAWT